jgi:hypothetical protein
MDISIEAVANTQLLDPVAREGLGVATSGVSVGGGSSRIHLLDDSQSNQDIANDILNNYDGLVVTADKTSMVEDDADPVISCADVMIASDSDVGYIVLLDGVEYASGTDAVSAGVADLTLASPVAGVYEIFIYRRLGNYASGSITITVSEV